MMSSYSYICLIVQDLIIPSAVSLAVPLALLSLTRYRFCKKIKVMLVKINISFVEY